MESSTAQVETAQRLRLIQQAAIVLDRKMSFDDHHAITTFIEALCRHSSLPVSAVTVNTPTVLKPHLVEVYKEFDVLGLPYWKPETDPSS